MILPLVLIQLRLLRIFTIIMTVWCIGYGGFELLFNLPVVYWPSSLAQLRSAVPVPAIRTGIEAVRDAFLVVRETKDLAAWGGLGFVIWHSGYFSICVWMVLFFMNGPRRLKMLCPVEDSNLHALAIPVLEASAVRGIRLGHTVDLGGWFRGELR